MSIYYKYVREDGTAGQVLRVGGGLVERWNGDDGWIDAVWAVERFYNGPIDSDAVEITEAEAESLKGEVGILDAAAIERQLQDLAYRREYKRANPGNPYND